MMDKVEFLILRNLIHNEEYVRKVIPFIKADYFEECLIKDNISFEKDVEELDSLSSVYFTLIPQTKLDKKGNMYLFAVDKKYSNKVHSINYDVHGKFRDFSIKNSFLRYTLVIFFLAALSFAIFGYIKVNY